jgi:hypothetical protein
MNTNKINPKYYFFNYPLNKSTNFKEVEEKYASASFSQKADSPGKIWGKITNPTDQFIILCSVIFLFSILIFVTFLLLFLIIYFK